MDSQRAKATKLVDSDVMGLGKETQRTRKTTNPVTQANMSRFGPANPQPRLTPTSIPFKKGGPAKGKAQKAAAVAGLLSALSQGSQGAPPGTMGAPPAPPMAAPPMGAPGMRRGGKAYANGGHADEAQDKVLFKRMFKQEEQKEAKMAGGGRATDAEGNRMNGMKRGGRSHKASGGVSHVPMRGEADHRPKYAKGGHAHKKKHTGSDSDAEEAGESASEEAAEEGMRRGGRYAHGGRCAKCGGAMSAKHMCGGGKMARGGVPRNKVGRAHFAMGGVGKIRHAQATPKGMPIKPKRNRYEDSLI